MCWFCLTIGNNVSIEWFLSKFWYWSFNGFNGKWSRHSILAKSLFSFASIIPGSTKYPFTFAKKIISYKLGKAKRPHSKKKMVNITSSYFDL